jgi:hypothetical protein
MSDYPEQALRKELIKEKTNKIERRVSVSGGGEVHTLRMERRGNQVEPIMESTPRPIGETLANVYADAKGRLGAQPDGETKLKEIEKLISQAESVAGEMALAASAELAKDGDHTAQVLARYGRLTSIVQRVLELSYKDTPAVKEALDRVGDDPKKKLERAQDLANYAVASGKDVDKLSTQEMDEVIKGHGILLEDVQVGGKMRKVIPESAKADKLANKRYRNAAGKEFDDSLTGSIGVAGNTQGLKPGEIADSLGLDYDLKDKDENPYYKKVKGGSQKQAPGQNPTKPGMALEGPKSLTVIEADIDQDMVDKAKIPLDPRLRQRAKEKAEVEGDANAKQVLDRSLDSAQASKTDNASTNEFNPFVGSGRTMGAKATGRKDEGTQTVNQELYAEKPITLKAGKARMIGVDEHGKEVVLAELVDRKDAQGNVVGTEWKPTKAGQGMALPPSPDEKGDGDAKSGSADMKTAEKLGKVKQVAAGGEQHSVWLDIKGRDAKLLMASEEGPLETTFDAETSKLAAAAPSTKPSPVVEGTRKVVAGKVADIEGLAKKVLAGGNKGEDPLVDTVLSKVDALVIKVKEALDAADKEAALAKQKQVDDALAKGEEPPKDALPKPVVQPKDEAQKANLDKYMKVSPDEILKECSLDWNVVRDRFAKDAYLTPVMNRMTRFRKEQVLALAKSIQQETGVEFEALGSEDKTSDLDLSFFTHGNIGVDTEVRAVGLFNSAFRKRWGKESGAVFDTNVYVRHFLPEVERLPDPNKKGEREVKEEKQVGSFHKVNSEPGRRGEDEKQTTQELTKTDQSAESFETSKRAKTKRDEVQDTASLVKMWMYMTDQEWETYKAERCKDPEGKRDPKVEQRFKEAEKLGRAREQELAAKIAELDAQNAANDRALAFADEKSKDKHAEMRASNELYLEHLKKWAGYARKVDELRAAIDTARGKGDKAEEASLTERYGQALALAKQEESMALMFANEPYFSEGAVVDVVGKQGKLDVERSPRRLLASFQEQLGDTLKVLGEDHGSFDELVVKSGKYTTRMTEAAQGLAAALSFTLPDHKGVLDYLAAASALNGERKREESSNESKAAAAGAALATMRAGREEDKATAMKNLRAELVRFSGLVAQIASRKMEAQAAGDEAKTKK